MGTFDDNRRTHAARTGAFRRDRVHARPARRATSACAAGSSASRSSPPTPTASTLDCYEAYNIQVAGLQQRLRGDRGPEGRHRRLRRPRLDARADRRRPGDGPLRAARAATSSPSRSRASRRAARRRTTRTGSCARSASPPQELDIRPTAELMLEEIGHPYADGEPVYDVTFENVQAGLRTDYLFRIANQRGGIVLGTGDLSELALGWATYGVGDQMSHYNVNAGVPKTLIQHLIRWVISSEQFERRGRARRSARSSTRRSAPSSCPARSCSRPSRRSARTRCTTSRSSTCCATGCGRRRSAFLAWHAWRDAGRGRAGRPASPTPSATPTTSREIRHWLEVFCRRFFAFAQFKRSALPNGPKVSAGGSLSPRGDWRAPSDGTAAAWLRDLARWDGAIG